eukprot:TRINITY_DN21884_c0_g1_i1.p1 TRINITY_DN21884_c0_g1~~TRINITY_DN21884_c0_g1_i1.p1  ORF type:complete len:538 (-),score=139.49 TRINITY_DN21884_c0_g1_i1:42-1655(-)
MEKGTQQNEKEVQELKKFFLREGNFVEHYDMQKSNEQQYKKVLNFLFEANTDLSTATRGRILAAAWARHDNELAKSLTSRGVNAQTNKYGVAEILRAIKLLDSNRRIKFLEKKLDKLTNTSTTGDHKVSNTTLGKIRNELNDLKVEQVVVASVTGSLSRYIRKWVGTIPKDTLEYFALSLPKDPWRELADIAHLRNTDFAESWFLDFCYDRPIPGGTLVSECSGWAKKPDSQRLELIEKWKLPYSFIRREVQSNPGLKLSADCKKAIVEYEEMNNVIWYYEELKAEGVDDIVKERILDGDLPTLPYGKLMQRLLDLKESNSTFYPVLIPIADRMLQTIRLPLEPPVVVIGDASGSMQVAVKTATIIGGLLACLTNADLRFFNSAPMAVPKIPRSCDDVIEVASRVRADGGTANAASLWQSYEKKEVVNYFIQVTDEEENVAYKGYRWMGLWKKYLAEVNPNAKVVFISFLGENVKGRMVAEYDREKLPYLQFVFNLQRPDLSKLDKVLAMLSSGAADKSTTTAIDTKSAPDEEDKYK